MRRYKIPRITIRFKLSLVVILITILPITATGFFLYSSASKALEGVSSKYLEQNIMQLNDNLDSLFKNIDYTYMALISNTSIKEKFSENQRDTIEQFYITSKVRIENEMKTVFYFNQIWTSNLVNSVFIFIDEQRYFNISQTPLREDAVINAKATYNRLHNTTDDVNILIPYPDSKIIFFVRNVYKTNPFMLNGRIMFGINEENFANLDSSVPKFDGTQMYIINNQGIAISSSDKSMLGKEISPALSKIKDKNNIEEIEINNLSYYAAAKKMSNYKLTTIITIPKGEVMHELNSLIYAYLFIILIVGIFSLLIGIILSSWFTGPISSLMKNLVEVKMGNFNTKMPSYKDYELNQLSEVFNTMTDEIQHLIHQVFEKQLLLKESELESLQSQVNPHFLFNVLETISWEARLSNNNKIYDMVTSLGKFFRATISMGSKERVPISEEIKYIEFYLFLQKMRYEDRLYTNIRIENEYILEYYIPKLCIQPLVENAIIHGLENKRGKGSLEISIAEEGNDVIIEVADDGIGFDTSEYDFNKPRMYSDKSNSHTSIGLYNVNRRIKLLYGNAYGLFIQSSPDSGTKARLKIPIDKEQ